LEWTFNGERFRIVGENQLKSFQDIVITLSTTTSITNDVYVQAKQELIANVQDHQNYIHRFV
jgi:hypothetical protein